MVDKRKISREEELALFARESKFTKLVFENRLNRQKFKEARQQALNDRNRQEGLTEERIVEMEKATLYDSMTGLLNSKTFFKKLDYEMRRAKRYKRPVSLLLCSIDNLEDIGKQYGALTIENILKAAAKIIEAAIRDVDFASRCAPTMFGVVFPETYSSRAIIVGERIKDKMKGQAIQEDLRNLRVTVSVGIVSFPTHSRDEKDLYFKAQEFLGIAHRAGGDRVYNG